MFDPQKRHDFVLLWQHLFPRLSACQSTYTSSPRVRFSVKRDPFDIRNYYSGRSALLLAHERSPCLDDLIDGELTAGDIVLIVDASIALIE